MGLSVAEVRFVVQMQDHTQVNSKRYLAGPNTWALLEDEVRLIGLMQDRTLLVNSESILVGPNMSALSGGLT